MAILQVHATAAAWGMPECFGCKTMVWHAAGFTDSIRPELADMGIHVAQVHPGALMYLHKFRRCIVVGISMLGKGLSTGLESQAAEETMTSQHTKLQTACNEVKHMKHIAPFHALRDLSQGSSGMHGTNDVILMQVISKASSCYMHCYRSGEVQFHGEGRLQRRRR